MGTEPDTRRSAGVRPIFWVLLAAAVLACATLIAVRYVHYRARSRAIEIERAQRGRAERVRDVAAVALVPLPVGSPLIERPGADAFGYPRSYVDRAQLRSLLLWRRYADLTKYTEEFQRAFEADFRTEYYVRGVADAFDSAAPELGIPLDLWVDATPNSFAPYLARGAHHFAAGAAARGSAWAKDTDATNFAAMRQEFELARADLKHALELSPRVIVALRLLMKLSSTNSAHAELEAFTQRALEICPACMQPRVVQQYALTPRWGGTYRQMEAAAAAAPLAQNPRFRLLPGYAENDRAEVFVRDKQLERALEHAERACALGDQVDFLLTKADIQRRMSNAALAIVTLRRAADLDPSDEAVSFALAHAELDAKDWRAAYRDLRAGLRIEPTDDVARWLKPQIVQGLVFAGWQAHEQGRDGEALDVLDEAAELEPSPEVEHRRSAVLTAGFQGTAAELDALDKAALGAPHDFAAHVRLDYALSTRRDWPRIEAMWTHYIQENELEARAYRERSGTLYRQGRSQEARADAQRACDLGSSAGCNLARR